MDYWPFIEETSEMTNNLIKYLRTCNGAEILAKEVKVKPTHERSPKSIDLVYQKGTSIHVCELKLIATMDSIAQLHRYRAVIEGDNGNNRAKFLSSLRATPEPEKIYYDVVAQEFSLLTGFNTFLLDGFSLNVFRRKQGKIFETAASREGLLSATPQEMISQFDYRSYVEEDITFLDGKIGVAIITAESRYADLSGYNSKSCPFSASYSSLLNSYNVVFDFLSSKGAIFEPNFTKEYVSFISLQKRNRSKSLHGPTEISTVSGRTIVQINPNTKSGKVAVHIGKNNCLDRELRPMLIPLGVEVLE